MAKPMKAERKAPLKDGPRYKVTAVSYIEGRLVGPGQASDEVVYLGIPGKHLIPLNAAAEKAKAAAERAKSIPPVNDLEAEKQKLAEERQKLEQERAAFEAEKKK